MSIISEKAEHSRGTDRENEDQNQDMELPLFELDTIVKATNNFSANKKLGEGGFGPVYKVNLPHASEMST